MRPTQRRFDSTEDGFIRANYRTMLAGDIARYLSRSTAGVRKRAAKLGLSVPIKRWDSKEDEIIRLSWGNRELVSVARELGRCLSEVSGRAKRLGCCPWRKRKGTHSGRPIDGFKNGSPIFTHRRVVEDIIGRKLRSDEIVHHIDGNKRNNEPANLYVFPSRSAHRAAHCSLESLIPVLLECGIVRFDGVGGVYKLCEMDKWFAFWRHGAA